MLPPWLTSHPSAKSLRERLKPRSAGHTRTECFPAHERHGHIRLAPFGNFILTVSDSRSPEHSIIVLASGTSLVKHPGSKCLYLKGKLKCRLSGFQTDKVHWNRARANLQFGFFHSLVPPSSFKEGKFWVLTFWFQIQSYSHFSWAPCAFLWISAVLCLLMDPELSP